ncbi:poly(hydroxyalkanoate) depolymerase family esterase [Bradyrhizobium diazoefficiens]
MSLARNIDLLRRLPKVDGLRFADFGRSADAPGPLQEVADFGDNPGNLRMFAFAPAQLQMPRALVVVLHGCGQTAAAYDLGAGWSTLARHYGFALLMPEQQRANNGNTCFNWFNPEDTARDSGEARSIREMIAHMVKTHRIDPRRVFITGLSAGGGMTSVMLATYPEVFAAGAVIAGLPYGIASNLREALDGMFHSPARPARELGDLVRNASDYRGPWPKMSVWHGSADRTVNPGNANEIVKQWLDLHDLPDVPMAETNVDGYPRQAWWNKDGETLVESYAITDMAHGTAARASRQRPALWRRRRVPDRGRHLLVLPHRKVLRPDRLDSGRGEEEGGGKAWSAEAGADASAASGPLDPRRGRRTAG